MELTKHKAAELYHFCNETADALRPVLNTDNPELNESYWISTLQNFIKVIESILQPGLDINFVKVDESFIKESHLKIFSAILNAKIQTTLGFDNVQAVIIESNLIAKQSLKELYGVELLVRQI